MCVWGGGRGDGGELFVIVIFSLQFFIPRPLPPNTHTHTNTRPRMPHISPESCQYFLFTFKKKIYRILVHFKLSKKTTTMRTVFRHILFFFV